MTHKEAYNIIKNRVEWQNSLNTDFNFLNFNTPESGRFLQEEHAAVRIPIIYETIVDVDISNTDFGIKLEYLKEKAILQMLHDVFSEQKEIQDFWINDYLGLFDYAIILKNSINTIFDILHSNRINHTDKITDSNLKDWLIDLNGLNNTANGIYIQGFVDRYRREIERIRGVLFLKKNRLKVVTAR